MQNNRNAIDRRALVTGGGSGIGRAICLELARAGWQIAVADIDAIRAAETVGLITQAGGVGQVELLDVASELAWAELCGRLQASWPSLDLVVNNAGVCAGGQLELTETEAWDWVHDINLRGVMLGCKTLIPWLKQNPRGGFIMNMASVAGLIHAPRMSVYNSSKAAVVALSETLHHELYHEGIGVTVVCPWFSPTNLATTGKFCHPAEAKYAAAQLRKSSVTPEAIARKGLAATFARHRLCVVGTKANVLRYLQLLCPPLLHWLLRWTTAKAIARSTKSPPLPSSSVSSPESAPQESR